MRGVVAVRSVVEGTQTLFYLSLFDDEIESRLDEFLAYGHSSIWTEPSLAAAALSLEPTDSVVIFSAREGILVARGGAANFPLYWTLISDSVLVSTVLPVDSECQLSRTGLLSSIAVVSVTFQNEPNLSLCTPLSGWFRCRRGAVSTLSPSAGFVSERPVDLDPGSIEPDRDQLIGEVRSAFDKFGLRLQGRTKALLELSGGFDSTLAAVKARAYGIELLGVSFHFPYYEFRFEEDIQQAVAEALAISRTRLDGTTYLPFAPPDWWPRLDEPATSVVG